MKKNVGSIDKVVRIIIAAVAVWAAYTHQVTSLWGLWDTVLYAVAIIMVLTVLLSTCPIWIVFGLNTLKSKLKS